MDESLEKLLADLVATSNDTSTFDEALSYFPEFKNVDSKLLADFVATAQDVGDINQAISYFPEFGGNKNINDTEPEKELVAETITEPEGVDSLKISKAKDFDKGIFKMAEREAYDKYKETGEVDISLIPKDSNDPNIIQDYLSGPLKMTASLFKGVGNLEKMSGMLLMDAGLRIFSDVNDEQRKALVTAQGKTYNKNYAWDKVEKSLDKYQKKYENESFLDDWEQGNKGLAVERAVGAAIESIPTTLAALSGYGGIIALGGGLAGNKFEEEYAKNPKKSIYRISGNALLSGATEASFELVTRGLAKKIGLLKDTKGIKAAKEFSQSAFQRILTNFGIVPLAEGASEAATRMSTDFIDYVTLGKDWSWEKSLKGALEEGIIGGISGGGFGTIAQFKDGTQEIKEAAALRLMSQSDKADIGKSIKKINEAVSKIEKANDAEKVLLEEIINEESAKINNIKRNSYNKLNNLSKKDLDIYARNSDKIQEEINNIKEGKVTEELALGKADQNIKNLTDANNDLIKEAERVERERKIKFIEEQGDLVLKASDQVRIDRAIREIESETGIEVDRSQIETNPENFKIEIINENNVDEILDKYSKDKTLFSKKDLLESAEGTYLANQGVILMSEDAALGVLEHEGVHNYFDIALNKLGNEDAVFAIAKVMMDKMKSIDANAAAFVDRVMKLYESDPRYKAKYVAEEVIAYYAQIKKQYNRFKKDDVSSSKLATSIRRLFQNSFNLNNVELTEDNVMRFIDDYLVAIEKGSLTKFQERFAKGEVEISESLKQKGRKIASKKRVEELRKQEEVDRVEDTKETGKFSKKIDLTKKSNQDILNNLVGDKDADGFYTTTKEEFTNSQAENAAKLLLQTGSFDSLIGKKILVTDPKQRQEILERSKDNIEKHISAFNPVKNKNLFGYINSYIQNKVGTAAKTVLKQPKTVPTSKKIGGEDSKVTVAETLVSDEISPEEYADIQLAKEKLEKIEPQQSAIANKIELTENELNLAKREIINFLRKTDRPAMTDPKKFFKALVDYTTGKGVQPGGFANVIYNKLSLPKNGELSTKNRESFIRKIAEDLIALNKVDPSVMRRSKWTPFYELEIKNMNPTQMQKAIDEGRIPSTSNLKSGLDLFKTLDPSVDQITEYLMNIRPDVLKRKMPKFLAEVIIKNEFNDIVDNTTQPVYDTKGNVTDNTIDLSETVTEEEVKRGAPQVREKIARPEGVKFSKSQQTIINDLNLDEKLKNSFEKNVVKILNNRPEATIDEAIRMEAKAIGKKLGFAYENVIIKRLKKLKIKGFEVSDQAGGNKVGIPDFSAKIFGNEFNVEVKMAKAQYGDVGLVFRNGKIDFNDKVKSKPYTFKDRIKKDLIAKAEKALENYRKRAGELGADLKLYDRTGKLPTEVFLLLGEGKTKEQMDKMSSKYDYLKEKYPNGIKGEGLQKLVTQTAEFDISPVKEIYENKIPPTNYIQLQDSGLFFMGKNPLGLPIAELTGNIDLTMRIMANTSVGKDGLTMTTVGLRVLPSNLRNIPKSNYNLDNASSVNSLLDTKEVKILETQVPAKRSNIKELSNSVVKFSKTETNQDIVGYAKTVDEALAIARYPNAPVKKIRVFDFDDTLAQTKSIVFYTKPDGTEGQLTAEEFAERGADLVAEGAVMDFSDFNIVRDGKRGPLFDIAKKIEKARGTEDVFVLTARAPESQQAIHEFLKSEGLNIPIENITGLGNSTGAAKAKWIVNKAADGYNDFYFADDAYQNVKAVQDALSQLDVKSKVQQAKVKFSKNVNQDFNKIIEQTIGIASEKEYSKAKAKVKGAGKGNKKFFIPYSAEDFMGLIYPLLSKGKLGDSQMAWFKQNLLDPYARAIENLSTDRLQLMEDFKALKKALEVPKNLRKKNDSGFTNEQAVRVYLFNKMGYDVPGLSKTDLQELIDIVNSDGLLKAFADQLMNVTKGDGYAKPGQSWLAGTITTDLIDVLNTVKRKKYLEQSGFLENAELIFSETNLNKLEAAYGEKYREAMENILKRMKSGKNRLFSGNRLSNRVLDYINGSIGAIMFFNARSAVLQTISAVNFVNWSFNNPIKAGKAFANQKQYWSDFIELMNSDYLMDRRNGLKLNISESEIADAAATSKNKAKAAISYILQKGFLPTQFADSFAIASGGATFYRNRINDLIKNEGLTEAEAKKKAMLEFRQVAEQSQQSSDPSKISAQQSSDLGRVILAFANTPMQYARLQKRAAQDLINGRGDAKSHVSKIIYYGVVQNIIFNALQQGLFALGFGDDEEDEAKNKRYYKVANGMLDSQLRGLGIAGATVGVVKNFLLDVYERSDRKRPEYVDAVYKLLQISPPISSKISKVRQAAYQFDSKKRREEIFEKGFSLDNPAYEASAKVISATTNIPLDRLYSKVNNIDAALAEDTEVWQSIAMLAGWPEWQIKQDKKDVIVNEKQKLIIKQEKIDQKIKAATGSTDFETIKKLNKKQQLEMIKEIYGTGMFKKLKKAKEAEIIEAIIEGNKEQ